MELNYPKICIQKNGVVYIHFHLKKKRYRLFNGKRLNIDLDPNSFPEQIRIQKAKLLCAEVYKYLSNGGLFKEYKQNDVITGKLTDKEYLNAALNRKIKSSYAKAYKDGLKSCHKLLITHCNSSKIGSKEIYSLLDTYKSNTTKNTVMRHLKALVSEAISLGMESNPLEGIKSFKANAKLHKPIENVRLLLEEIRLFNTDLFLCCLLTYGCLLRPHQEIRLLTWGDFSDDIKFIHLSGSRNKSGKNRSVPVPLYIRENLIQGDKTYNIFSGSLKPYNISYFKCIWRRFKKVSKLLEQDQTLYSFRHSGAIEIYKRTGSLSKLQKAMGHSSLAVSLTYLRGLEVSELEESDMPVM